MESRNRLKIKICEEFDVLNDKQRKHVLIMIENEFGFKQNISNNCQCLRKILFNCVNNKLLTYDVLVKMYDYIKQLPKSIRNNRITSVSPKPDGNVILFPLMDLPFE